MKIKFIGIGLAACALVIALVAGSQHAHAQFQVDRGNQISQEMLQAQMELQQFDESRQAGQRSLNESRKWMIWAPIMGVAFFGFLVIAAMYRRRMTNKSSTFGSGGEIAPEIVKSLTQSFTTGKQSPEEVGQAIIEALRMGTYANYRRLFPTPREVDTFMSPERSKAYKQQVLAEAHLRAAFKRLHEAFFDAQGNVERFATGEESGFAYGADPSATLPSIASCALAFRNGQDAVASAMVKVCTGWRLLVPG